MDFSSILRSPSKKPAWMDIIFYFVISSLVASVFCYLIFMTKNGLLREDMKQQMDALQTVGTAQQKKNEEEVISYQKRISEFADLLKNHGFASHAFDFMSEQTLPNIWFKQFTLDQKSAKMQLSGEADGLEYVSRQVATFEKNKNVTNIGNIGSSLAEGARNSFNLNLSFDQSIFDYFSIPAQVLTTTSPADQATTQPGQTTKSSDREILSFRLISTPEVAGVIDQNTHSITVSVPQGTNLKNIRTSVIASAKATVSPVTGLPQDFTVPVKYRVTAENGLIQEYTVTANIQSSETESPQKNNIGIFIIIGAVAAVAILLTVLFLLIRRRAKGANIVPRK